MITDSFGFLGQIQDDGSIEGGDSVNWTAHFYYITNKTHPRAHGDNQLSPFEVGFGAYVRHPYPKQTIEGFGAYYKNPWDGVMSRDQLTGVLGFLVASKDRLAMLRLVMHHAAWLFLFSYNTRINGQDPSKAKWKWPDLTLMDVWAMEARGVLGWWSLPVTTLFDLHMLIAAIIQRLSPKADHDPISAAMKWSVAREFYQSPTSWLAWKLLNKTKLIEDIKAYWSGWRSLPEMGWLWQQKINTLD